MTLDDVGNWSLEQLKGLRAFIRRYPFTTAYICLSTSFNLTFTIMRLV